MRKKSAEPERLSRFLPQDPLMKRCLSYSAAAHGILILVLLSGLIRPAPIRLGPTYGVDFMGKAGGEGGGGRPKPPEPVEETSSVQEKQTETKAPIAQTLTEEEKTWNIRRKKTKAKKHVLPKKPAAPHPIQPTRALPAEQTGEGGEGGGIGIGLGPGMGAGKVGGGGGGFPYSWYLMSIRTKLWQEWSRWAGSNSPHNCVVIFSIEREGSVSGIKLDKSSGDPFYDKMALRAVQYAAPFPPLPEGFGRSALDLIVEFKFLAGE